MGRNNEDFFKEHEKNHASFWDWDGNGSNVAYTDVRKGVDHPDVQHTFLNGHCHGLACHINELNGNTIGRIRLVDEDEEETKHFFNYDHKDPEMGIDIHGRRPIKDMMHDVASPVYKAYHEPITPKEMHDETADEDKWLPIAHGASKQVAQAIIRKL